MSVHLSISRQVVCVALVLALGGGATVADAAPAPPGAAGCAACIVVDDTGRVLLARNAAVARPNASTTKIVTALVVRAEASLEELVTVSPLAAATGGGGLDLTAGDGYTVEALLHALLMTSSNDAAVALAEHVSGDEHAFVEEMNETALRLGASDTRFVTAHGLDRPGHGSSARDLARLSAVLLDDPVLADIVATRKVRIERPDGVEILENRNVLLETYADATGVKTGYTRGAGEVLVASAERAGRRLIAVAMGSVNAAADATTLLDRGWELLAQTRLVPAGETVGMLVFDPSGATEVATAQPLRGPHDPAGLQLVFDPDAAVAPPIVPGQRVGAVLVRDATGAMIGTVPAVATGAVHDHDAASLGERLIALVLRTAGRLVGP